eukprot:GHRR01009445.1.p1 GENE.GHRR01009445.1~~GHRR01009445.1.p1  ORF type:complete len:249 (+),score=81.12 GHRR01009445.1:434-1180(+)
MQNMSLLGSPLKQLWSAYEHQLEKRPVLTQVTTSALLWGTGDLIAQRLEHWEQQQQRPKELVAAGGQKMVPGVHASSAELHSSSYTTSSTDGSIASLVVDWRRAMITGLFGAMLVGPVGHFWYINLDRWCKKIVPSGGPAFIGTKVLIDTVVMGPFYVTAFFAWGCALIDNSGMQEFKRKMKVDFWPTLAAEASAWPLIQSVNFSLVPLQHQLLVINTLTVIDAAFMSWARSQKDWLGKLIPGLRKQQ